jgi:hypothetical protein
LEEEEEERCVFIEMEWVRGQLEVHAHGDGGRFSSLDAGFEIPRPTY